MNQNTFRQNKTDCFRTFLRGGPQKRNYVILDPSTYAAEFAGKTGGYPTYDDNLAFHQAFQNDCPISAFIFPDDVIPQLKWAREYLETKGQDRYYCESLKMPGGVAKRIIAERPGTQPWIVKAPVQTEKDFDLIDYYAESTKAGASLYAQKYQKLFSNLKSDGFMPGMVLLTSFEVYYLIDYPDQPLFYYDHTERYLKSVAKVNEANMAVAKELAGAGCEIFYMGSAGLELLSPRIFDEAIIPFVREVTDFIRKLNCFSSYHICGHSGQLLKTGRINALKPTWFETFSTPPCGDNKSLSDGLRYLDTEIVSKGNLPLEILRNGTPDDIRATVKDIIKQSRDRRHIIGQADATILSGTPRANIETVLQAANNLTN
jgi:uroporphyrinogen-III decarboxylase